MGVIRSVILDEYDRSQRMLLAYRKELELLPKGSVTKKTISGRTYYYWMYRENGKVVNKYISEKDNDIDTLFKLVQKRRQLQNLIKSIKIEIAEMERYLKVNDDGR